MFTGRSGSAETPIPPPELPLTLQLAMVTGPELMPWLPLFLTVQLVTELSAPPRITMPTPELLLTVLSAMVRLPGAEMPTPELPVMTHPVIFRNAPPETPP